MLLQFTLFILFIIYTISAYWATGQTIYYNKIVFHRFGELFIQRLILGYAFGVILIPWALITHWLRNCGESLSVDQSSLATTTAPHYYEEVTSLREKTKKLWLIIAVVAVVVSVIFIIIREGNTDYTDSQNSTVSGRVVFCTDVDSDLNPINEGDQFTIGTLCVILQSSQSFGTDTVKILLYKVEDNTESFYYTSEENISPNWINIALQLNYTETETYRVEFSITGKGILGDGTVTIQ